MARKAITSRQRFTVKDIPRGLIVPAPYNPRIIEAEARDRLKAGMARFGLVEPLVWNERTGHLVGGHQRLKILDEGGQDYTLTVCAINVDEQAEQKINVLLNNASVMGLWDQAALERLLLEIAEGDPVGVESTGFSMSELLEICEPGELTTLLSGEMAARRQANAKPKKEPSVPKAQKPENVDHCITVVFRSSEEATGFLRGHYLSTDNRYIDGHRFMAAVGLSYTERGNGPGEREDQSVAQESTVAE